MPISLGRRGCSRPARGPTRAVDAMRLPPGLSGPRFCIPDAREGNDYPVVHRGPSKEMATLRFLTRENGFESHDHQGTPEPMRIPTNFQKFLGVPMPLTQRESATNTPRSIPMPPEFYSIKDVAERLGVSTDTVKDWVRRGVNFPQPVPPRPPSNRVRFRAAEIETYIAQGAK